MKDLSGTNRELIEEISALKQKIPELEHSDSERKRSAEKVTSDSRMRDALVDNIPGCISLVLKKGTRETVVSNTYTRQIGAVPGEQHFKACAIRDDNCPFCLAPKRRKTGKLQQIEVEYPGKWYEGSWATLSERFMPSFPLRHHRTQADQGRV